MFKIITDGSYETLLEILLLKEDWKNKPMCLYSTDFYGYFSLESLALTTTVPSFYLLSG